MQEKRVILDKMRCINCKHLGKNQRRVFYRTRDGQVLENVSVFYCWKVSRYIGGLDAWFSEWNCEHYEEKEK